MMSIRKAALACVSAAMMALSLNAAAQTGPRNQDTYFTFSQPVELPTKTLPAGTYFFQLMDSDSNRHIVKIMDKDRKELFATLMAIPYYSTDRPSDEPQVRFMETPATTSNGATAATNAIKIWFYPGNTVGHEFIYPRSQAMRIASRTGQSVLTTKSDADVSAESELSRVDSNGADTEANVTAQASPENPNAPSQPAAAETSQQTAGATSQQTTTDQQSARDREQVGAITGGSTTPDRRNDTAQAQQPAPTPAPATDTTTATRARRTNLPHTAGVLPLLALMGLGSLAGSRLVKKVR